MKPIIVTYSNESYVMEAVGWFSIMEEGIVKDIPNSAHPCMQPYYNKRNEKGDKRRHKTYCKTKEKRQNNKLKTMTKKFAVKSNSFSLYKAFKEEAEKMGWKYNGVFNPFDEEKMNFCNCLYFCENWSKSNEYKFSMSNASTGVIFQLGTQWDEALLYAKNLIDNEKEKEKELNYYVTLADLVNEFADNRGIDRNLIIIKF